MEGASEHAKLNEEMWDLRADTWCDRRFSYLGWTQRKLFSLLELGEGTRLLDLGCGTGWAVRFAASSANWRGEFYGIDISSRMIEKAQAGVADHKNVHFRKANAEKLPFDNAFFDIVICCNSFHHYFSPSNVLSEVYRVLRPNGKFYVLDITADGIPTRILDWLAKKREPAHVKFYSTREFRKFFGEAGLQYLTSKPIVLSAKVHITQKQLDAATQSSS